MATISMHKAKIKRVKGSNPAAYLCENCGEEWAPAITNGGRRPAGWWKCPNLCNIHFELALKPEAPLPMSFWRSFSESFKAVSNSPKMSDAAIQAEKATKPGHNGHLEVLAGDLGEGRWEFGSSSWKLTKIGFLQAREEFDLQSSLERVELHTEDSAKRLSGTLGWGAAGLVALGPIGAVAGVIVGGKGKKVLFTGYLKGGHKFLARTDGKTWERLLTLTFGN